MYHFVTTYFHLIYFHLLLRRRDQAWSGLWTPGGAARTSDGRMVKATLSEPEKEFYMTQLVNEVAVHVYFVWELLKI